MTLSDCRVVRKPKRPYQFGMARYHPSTDIARPSTHKGCSRRTRIARQKDARDLPSCSPAATRSRIAGFATSMRYFGIAGAGAGPTSSPKTAPNSVGAGSHGASWLPPTGSSPSPTHLDTSSPRHLAGHHHDYRRQPGSRRNRLGLVLWPDRLQRQNALAYVFMRKCVLTLHSQPLLVYSCPMPKQHRAHDHCSSARRWIICKSASGNGERSTMHSSKTTGPLTRSKQRW